ncbi:LppU/SCO3897 family protein [Saccharothrix yanglingensis]|nr:hypothetical protein [Saccharothrix yanglingensis]
MGVVLVAVIGGVAAIIATRVLNPAPPTYAAGDCVKTGGGQFHATVEKVDCGDRGAVHEVGLYLDDPDADCPAESYSSYEQTGGKEDEFKLCLVLNASEGDCFSIPTISLGEEKKVDCGSDEANRRVTEVVDGTADKAACASDSVENARVYPAPERTVCLGPVPA